MQVSRGWCCPSINLFPVFALIFDLIASLGSGISTVFSCDTACIGTEYVSNQIQQHFFHSAWNSAALGVSSPADCFEATFYHLKSVTKF